MSHSWIDEALREHAQDEQAEHEQAEAPDAAGRRQLPLADREQQVLDRIDRAGAAARGSGKNASRCRTARAARRPRP